MLASAARTAATKTSAPAAQRAGTAPGRRTGSVGERSPSTANPVWQQIAWHVPNQAGPDGARLHTDAAAASSAERLGAVALTVGRDIFFARNQYAPGTPHGDHVLRHELAHVAQSSHQVPIGAGGGVPLADVNHPAELEARRIADRGGRPAVRAREPMAFRIPAVPQPVARKTRDQIFGNAGLGIAGMNLGDFQDYTEQVQADWFVEPTLAAADRASLWELLLTSQEGGHIRNGIGDLLVADLAGVAAADWPGLKTFCRGTDPSLRTVRIFPPFPGLPDRIALGKVILDLESFIPPDQLNITVSQSQVVALRLLPPLMPLLKDYWTRFQPSLEQTFTPGAAGSGPEFQLMIGLLSPLIGMGLAPLLPLQGATPAVRWVRNLHRFPLPMLLRLVTNLGETGGAREFVLVLHGGHDPSASFLAAAGIFSDLVMNTGAVTMWGKVFGPDNLVLMIEGATSLADMTARIPGITTTYGKRDAHGNRHINQVVIAGHGSGHSVSLAGSGPPVVHGEDVDYPQEHLDTGGNLANTQALLDALLRHMDPATARLLYAGCLVGSRTVAPGTPAAAIPAALAADQSLRAFTEARAVAAGLPITPGVTVQGAQASVGIGGLTSLTDRFGRLKPNYPADPHAFGAAANYAQAGLEPEGVLRAAVEVASISGVVPAETMLRTRWAMPANPASWYDRITRIMVGIVLPPVAGSGVDLFLLNEAANTAQVPFLVYWPRFPWINAAAFVTRLNPQPFAANVYAGLAATTEYTAPATDANKRLRIVVDQGQFIRTGAAATLFAGITASGLHATALQNYLDISATVLGGREATLMPLVGAPTAEQIRLALAWFALDSTNAHVRAFLSAQVVVAAGVAPAFNAAAAAEIGAAGQNPRTILTSLGFVLAPAGAAVGGGAARPFANVQLPGRVQNTVFVTPGPRKSIVVPAGLNVRTGPSMGHPSFAVVHAGDVVTVTGESGDWVAIDMNGRLGFVYKPLIAP